MNLIGKLQLSSEKTQEEENRAIVELRILRTQEAIIKIIKMRKTLTAVLLEVFNAFKCKK